MNIKQKVNGFVKEHPYFMMLCVGYASVAVTAALCMELQLKSDRDFADYLITELEKLKDAEETKELVSE